MTYLGEGVSQLDGSKYSQSNCVLASTTELMDCSTLGFWRVKPSNLRIISGDTEGGVSYTLAASTAKKATAGEVDLTVIYWAPENSTTSTLDNLLDSPRVTAVSISAAVTRYTPFRTGTYTGGHTVIAGAKRFATVTRADGTKYQQKQVYVMDAGHLEAKWVWWPWSLLIKAAKARTGNNTIHVLYTRDLGGVSRVAKEDGAIRSSAKVILSPSNKVGTITKGNSYTVQETVRGGSYSLDGRTMSGWNKLGTGKYCVAKIR